MLGGATNNDSVYLVDSAKSSPTAPTSVSIQDACLGLIRSLMLNFAKDHVTNEVIAAFDVSALKCAREKLYKHLYPGKPYTYRGPNNNNSDRKKAISVFSSIYDKITELEGKEGVPSIVVPAEELHVLLRVKTCEGNHRVCDDKIEKLRSSFQEQIDDIKRLSQSYAKVAAVPNTGPVPPVVLSSSGGRGRIDSVKRKISDTEMGDVDDSVFVGDSDGYSYQRGMRRKMARKTSGQRKSGDKVADHFARGPPAAKQPQSASTHPQQKSRRGSVWGKGATSNSGFKGVAPNIPQVFVSRCDKGTTEDQIADHLTNEGIKVREVIQQSHEEAVYKSFVVTVEKHIDFKKLVSGDHVPEFVNVRPFRRPRDKNQQGGRFKPSGNVGGAPNSFTYYSQQVDELHEVEQECSRESIQLLAAQKLSEAQAVNGTVAHLNAVTAASSLHIPNDVSSRKPNE